MKQGKIITGVAVGAVIALLLIPKTRRMITELVSGAASSLKDLAGNAAEMTDKAKQLAVN